MFSVCFVVLKSSKMFSVHWICVVDLRFICSDVHPLFIYISLSVFLLYHLIWCLPPTFLRIRWGREKRRGRRRRCNRQKILPCYRQVIHILEFVQSCIEYGVFSYAVVDSRYIYNTHTALFIYVLSNIYGFTGTHTKWNCEFTVFSFFFAGQF